MESAAAPARRGRGVLLRRARRRAARLRSSPRRRRRGLHGRLLHREDGLLGLRLLHEELLLLHGDHHLLPARERSTRAPRTGDAGGRRLLGHDRLLLLRHGDLGGAPLRGLLLVVGVRRAVLHAPVLRRRP